MVVHLSFSGNTSHLLALSFWFKEDFSKNLFSLKGRVTDRGRDGEIFHPLFYSRNDYNSWGYAGQIRSLELHTCLPRG